MALAGWLAALSVGLLAGAVSGLVGIGGGAIMVPFLYFFLARPELSGAHFPPAEQAVVAHATSLLTIVPISLRGAWLYGRAGLVDWSAVWKMGAASVVAAVLGVRVAVVVPGELLKSAFGVFLLVMATQLVFGKRRTELHGTESGNAVPTGSALAGGAAVGFFSALLGVGGGLVAIPVLIYALHTSLRRVSGTSLALITFTALTGVGAYAVSGWLGVAGNTLAYFHVSASVPLALGALVAVPLGTAAQMRMSAQALRWVFAAVFFLLGLRIAVSNLLILLGR
jgi:uncharacterized membrane protein YfcA